MFSVILYFCLLFDYPSSGAFSVLCYLIYQCRVIFCSPCILPFGASLLVNFIVSPHQSGPVFCLLFSSPIGAPSVLFFCVLLALSPFPFPLFMFLVYVEFHSHCVVTHLSGETQVFRIKSWFNCSRPASESSFQLGLTRSCSGDINFLSFSRPIVAKIHQIQLIPFQSHGNQGSQIWSS